MTNTSRFKRQAGFSLVEVSIAMAIAAVALVSLIGLIPQGLKTMEEAADQSIEARIHQQVLSELQLTPFRDKSNNPDISTSPLRQFHRQIRIYDAQGVELGYQTRGGTFTKAPSSYSTEDLDFNWNYTARIWMPIFEAGEAPPSMDEGSNSKEVIEDGGEELLTVIVEIVPFAVPGNGLADRLGNTPSFLNDSENFSQIHAYQTTIVRMGQDFYQ